MSKILVTGASGLVGSRLVVRLRERHDVHGTYASHEPLFLRHPRENLHRIDVGDLEGLRALVDEVAPEVIIHCAAMTNVDGCEDVPKEARATNVLPAGALAKWSRATKGRLVLMSTDYVFDGTNPPYEIDAAPNPLCVYSRTKAEAEEAVRGAPGFLIARSTVIYGADFGHLKRNFATWLIDELGAGRKVRVINDQWNTPTISENIAEFLELAIERRLVGVIHAAVSECLPRDEFARRIAVRFGLDPGLITPIPTEALRQKALRPKRPCISMRRSEELLGVKAWTIVQSLDLLHRQLQSPDRSVLLPWW